MPDKQDMPRTVYYHQGCPVCGRRLQIDVSLLGNRVYCQHCGGGFIAMDDAMIGGQASRNPIDAARRADILLHRAAMALEQAGIEADDSDR